MHDLVLSVVTPPAPIVTLDEAKAHLRVTSSSDDGVITSMVAAAVQAIDGATGWLGRALGLQTLRLSAREFPGALRTEVWPHPRRFHCAEIVLPCPPIVSVTAVAYVDPTGAPVTLDPSTYALSDRVLYPLDVWPATIGRPGSMSVTYQAGYASGVPDLVKAAVLLMVHDLYTMRSRDPALITDSVFGVGSQQFSATANQVLTGAAERLLSTYRVFA